MADKDRDNVRYADHQDDRDRKDIRARSGDSIVSMDSKVLRVLNNAYSGYVVDRRRVAEAIREYVDMIDDMNRQGTQPDMVTISKQQLDNMRDIIQYQDKKLKDMTHRMNAVTHGYLPNSPLPTEKDEMDRRRRRELVQKFQAIYDNEWVKARREMLENLRWREVEVVYTLQRVIRSACDLCYRLASDQIDKLIMDMEEGILNPTNGPSTKSKPRYSEQEITFTKETSLAERHALEFRKARAEDSVPVVIDTFYSTAMRSVLDPNLVGRELTKYINKVVEVVWLMTTLEPPMQVFSLRQTDRVWKECFGYYGMKGDFVNQTVWPAVFYHSNGPLASKGYVMAM